MAQFATHLDARREHNPLFNDNKLKLGLFGVNVSNGCAITTIEGRHNVTWPTNLSIARTADRYAKGSAPHAGKGANWRSAGLAF
ncbi:MAG: Alkanesulfonate monooxygenase [Rhodospirillales bacterium]|jgi:hypothetical protein|nr:Alkanesulfonate monooxygenase [Rhodospirillales bacterium]